MTSRRALGWWAAGTVIAVAVGAGLWVIGGPRSGPADKVGAEPLPPPWFEDATEAAGVRFTHDAGPTGSYFLPQIIGSGAALFDCDGDGRLDLYLVQNGGPNGPKNRLFRQKADGTFEDISAGSGLDVAGFGMGVAVGDVNNDGWPDVLLTEYRGTRLFLNNGDRTFTEVTVPAGLASPHWATSASFLDFDRDGWLDLVVVHYVDYDPSQHCPGASGRPDYCHPNFFHGTVAQLYRNLGRQPDGKVKFQDVTLTSGLAQRPGPALGVLCADFNGDGWPDIFVANDAKANHLWINQKDGTFREEAVQRGCAYNEHGRAEGNMGIAFGDVSGEGLPSLLITHLTEERTTLWKQGPPGQFTDRTFASGLGSLKRRGTGWGIVLADFDQDGRLDLALVNGRIARAPGSHSAGFNWADYAENNLLLANDGRGRVRDRSAAERAFCGVPRLGRGLCAGDIFGTGRVDLLATYVNGPARLYRNVAPQAGHWLLVRAVLPPDPAAAAPRAAGTVRGRDAYGAAVTVRAGVRQWVRYIQPGSSYLSSNDPRAHFGLGTCERVDAIRVAWPDGTLEDFPGGPVDRRLTLRQGDGKKN
jgi:hypothetical protein